MKYAQKTLRAKKTSIDIPNGSIIIGAKEPYVTALTYEDAFRKIRENEIYTDITYLEPVKES